MRVVVLVLAITTGCAANVARVSRELGDGPVRVDRERPVLVYESGDSPDSVVVPLLVDATLPGYFGPCTVRGGWVPSSARDSLTIPFFALRAGRLASPQTPVTAFDAQTVHEAEITLVPDATSGFGPGPDAQPRPLLIAEMWLSADTGSIAACSASTPPMPPTRPSSLVVLDFDIVRPIGGALTGGGAFLIGVVAITGLVALILGG